MKRKIKDETISKFVERRNKEKKLFTAGPASLIDENLYGLMPCFGRGDIQYDLVEKRVLNNLKDISGHSKIARLQGSGSTAMEVMIKNFCYGKILVIDTGYYSTRVAMMAQDSLITYKQITNIDKVDWKSIDNINGTYDWIIACYTETSIGLKLNIDKLKKLSKKTSSKLMLDATASIGLEDDHYLADVISFSSCKGLFGLTGAGFISFNQKPNFNVPSFSLSLENHLNKMMTGPYHAICSLDYVLQKHSSFKFAVEKCKNHFIKKYSENLVYGIDEQPKLCTQISGSMKSLEPNAVLYNSRSLAKGFSVVCHLGEAHLEEMSDGKINDVLTIK